MADKSLVVATKKLAAPIVVEDPHGLEKMGKYTGAAGVYEIFSLSGGGPLMATDVFALYPAKLPSGQLGLMKISQGGKYNDVLDQEARILATLKTMADEDAATNYGAFFPQLVEAFVPDGVDRQVLFLGYHPSVREYRQLVPMTVAIPDNKRVDLQTVAWMLAKGAKLLSFVHETGFSIGFVDASNILLEPNLHGVFALDFSNASEEALTEEGQQEVRDFCRLVWNAGGGSVDKRPPHDTEIMSVEDHEDFVAFLKDLVTGEWGARDVVTALYERADRYWPKTGIEGDPTKGLKRQFHSWVLLPR